MSTPLIEVTFFKSRSKAFAAVLSHAKCFSSLTKDDNKYTLSLTALEELFEHPSEFIYVLSEATKWVGTTVRYNGILVIDKPKTIPGKIKEVTRCYSTYSGASDKRIFCNYDGNGCRMLNTVNLNGIDGFVFRRWYKFGQFKTETKYAIDKACIKEMIEMEAEEKMLDLCPSFNLDLVNIIVDALPDTLDTTTGQWNVVYERILTAEGYSTVPFSVEPSDVFEADETPLSLQPKAEKPIDEMSESEINEMLDKGLWKL